jgi:hypothetical protein
MDAVAWGAEKLKAASIRELVKQVVLANELVSAKRGCSANSGDEGHCDLLLEPLAIRFPSPCIRGKFTLMA